VVTQPSTSHHLLCVRVTALSAIYYSGNEVNFTRHHHWAIAGHSEFQQFHTGHFNPTVLETYQLKKFNAEALVRTHVLALQPSVLAARLYWITCIQLYVVNTVQYNGHQNLVSKKFCVSIMLSNEYNLVRDLFHLDRLQVLGRFYVYAYCWKECWLLQETHTDCFIKAIHCHPFRIILNYLSSLISFVMLFQVY